MTWTRLVIGLVSGVYVIRESALYFHFEKVAVDFRYASQNLSVLFFLTWLFLGVES